MTDTDHPASLRRRAEQAEAENERLRRELEEERTYRTEFLACRFFEPDIAEKIVRREPLYGLRFTIWGKS